MTTTSETVGMKRTKRNVASLYRKAAKFLDEHPERWGSGAGFKLIAGDECYCAMGLVQKNAGHNPDGWIEVEGTLPSQYAGSRNAEKAILNCSLYIENDALRSQAMRNIGDNRHKLGTTPEIKKMKHILRKIAAHLEHGGKL